jgi:hypothetical protein
MRRLRREVTVIVSSASRCRNDRSGTFPPRLRFPSGAEFPGELLMADLDDAEVRTVRVPALSIAR